MLPRLNYAFSGTQNDLNPLHDHLDEVIPKVQTDWLGKEVSHLIGGKSATGVGEPRPIRSPIDQRLILGYIRDADQGLVDVAYQAARTTVDEWRRTPWSERVRRLRIAGDLLEQDRHEIGALLILEVGKSRAEAMGEAEEAVAMIRYYCDVMEGNGGWDQQLRVQVQGEATRNTFRPFGVFAVVSPFNFPLALSTSMISAALIAGNTVVYKPNDRNGISALKLTAALHAAGVPAGALNVVLGGRTQGRMVIDHENCDGVAFTGSHAVGMSILRNFSRNSYARPVIAEMGGKNPVIVTASADVAAAVSGVSAAVFGLQGQKCSACSRAFVHRDIFEQFTWALREKADSLVVGDPRRRDVYMGPLVDESAFARYASACEAARTDGALLAGGERRMESGLEHGYFVEPAIATRLAPDHWILRDELFAPIVALVPFTDFDTALRLANQTSYGLSAGIYSGNDAELDCFFDRIEAGITYANRPSSATTGAWPGSQSFCGWKGSGTTGKGGLGPSYILQFMREQSRTIRSSQVSMF